MNEKCQPEIIHPAMPLYCQLAPKGVLANWLREWATGFGYYDPSWEPEMKRQLDEAIARVLPELAVYNSWSYRGTCWKKQKIN